MDLFEPRFVAAELSRIRGDGVAVVVDPSLHWEDIFVEVDPDSADGWARIRCGELAHLDWVCWLYTEHERAKRAQKLRFLVWERVRNMPAFESWSFVAGRPENWRLGEWWAYERLGFAVMRPSNPVIISGV